MGQCDCTLIRVTVVDMLSVKGQREVESDALES